MEVDNPKTPIETKQTSSRDPRLASNPNRPCDPRRVSSFEGPPPRPELTQQPPPPPPPPPPVATKNDFSEPFTKSIGSLVQAALAASQSKDEKERIQRRKNATEGLLKRAQVYKNFPSMLAQFHQTKKDGDIDLKRIDESMNMHLSICRQLEDSLQAKLDSKSPVNSSNLEEKLGELEDQVKQAASVTMLRETQENNRSLTEKVKILQSQVSQLQKSSATHSSTLGVQSKHSKKNYNNIADLFEKMGRRTDDLRIQKDRFDDFTEDFDKFKRKFASLDSEVGSILKSRSQSVSQIDRSYKDDMGKEVEAIKGKISQLEATSKDNTTMVTLERQFTALNSRLIALEKARAAGVPGQSMPSGDETRPKVLEASVTNTNEESFKALRSELQDLAERFKQLTSLQEMESDMRLSEIENFKESLKAQADELQKLKDNHSHISTEITKFEQVQATSVANSGKIVEMSGDMQRLYRFLETLRVALHSLETRYNNLTTETIVKHMVAAMQEMYPSQRELMEQVTALKAQIDNWPNPHAEIAAIRTKLEGLWATVRQTFDAQSEQMNRIMKIHEDSRGGFVQSLNLAFEKLNPMWEKFSSESTNTWPAEEFQQIQLNVNALVERLNAVDEHFKSKETDDATLLQNINQERNRLDGEMKDMHSKLQELASKFDELQATESRNESGDVNINTIVDNILRLGDSTSSVLLRQLAESKKGSSDKDNTEREREREQSPSGYESTASNSPKREPSPSDSESGSNADNTRQPTSRDANVTPLEKRKKKRLRSPSLPHDDESLSGTPSNSQRVRPQALTPVVNNQPGGHKSMNKKKGKNKNKKRRLLNPNDPVVIE